MSNKGLGNLQTRLDKKAKDRESRNNRVRLSEGEVASIRILQEADDFFVPDVHPIQDVSAKGKTFWRRFICDGEECQWCEKEFPRAERIYVWVWVNYILHKILQEGQTWEKIKNRAGNIFYKESVNEKRILETGIGKSRYIAMKFINMNTEYGTLGDRDYNWVRTGSGKEDTTYDLIPTNPKEFEHSESVGTLQDLEEAIRADSVPYTKGKEIEVNVNNGEEDLF